MKYHEMDEYEKLTAVDPAMFGKDAQLLARAAAVIGFSRTGSVGSASISYCMTILMNAFLSLGKAMHLSDEELRATMQVGLDCMKGIEPAELPTGPVN